MDVNAHIQVGWHELHRVSKPSRDQQLHGNGRKAKGFPADLRAKPLKIPNTFSQESVTDWSENRKTWTAFCNLQFTGEC